MTECPGTWVTLVLAEVSPGDGVGVFVEAAGERLVARDVAEAVGDLLESDVFVVEGLARNELPGVQAAGARPADLPDLGVAGVFGGSDAFGVGSGCGRPP